MNSILVYTRTAGYRHRSIPAGIRALTELGEQDGFTVEATEDPTVFRPDSLARHRAVVFLSTTRTVLDNPGRAALRDYVCRGGGGGAIHSAAGTEYDWAYYGDLVGARFTGHPEVQTATVTVEDRDHDATAHLDSHWTLTDEWFNFAAQPPASARILLSIDERRYHGGTMGSVHPLAWCREFDGGRTFYTALGHRDEAYEDPLFRRHLLGALHYTTRTTPADATPADATP
jgi:type 1 glutamine amidotransferase